MFKKLLHKIKKNKNYFIAFLIPFILLSLIYFSLGFFSRKTLLVSDMAGQYKMLYMFFKENGFLNYTFSKGLGGPMIGTYAYYLMSPFNFLVFLFSENNIHIALLLIVWLKISLSGFTMYFYLNKKFPNKKYLYLFSSCYALMGFNSAYYFHIMWLDAVMLLPLLIYGIDKIVKNKSPILYFITLLLIIYCNYYIGYMVCIFSCIYFIYSLVINYTKKDKNEIIKVCKSFIITSLLAGLSVMFLLIPTLLEFSNMPKSDMDVFSRYPLSIDTNIFNFMSKLFLGNHNGENVLAYNSYFVYTGIITFILLLLYFMNNKISKKEKIASFVVIFIFLISIFVNYVDFIWHGFNLPVCFYGRYIFLLSFFIITLATKCFINIKGITNKHLWIIAPIFPIMGVLILMANLEIVKVPLVFVSVFLYFIYLIMLSQKIVSDDIKINKLLVLLVIGELFLNYYFEINTYNFIYTKESIGEYKTNIKEIDKIKENENSKFYRIGKTHAESPIDSLYYGYNGNATFLSTVNKNEMEFLGKVGYNVHDNMSEYFSSIPVIDSILDVKYIITTDKTENLYEKYDSYKVSLLSKQFYDQFKIDLNVYKNNYALSLGTVISQDASKCKIDEESNDRLKYQNDMIKCLTGDDKQIYQKIELEKINDNTYKFKNSKKLDFYSFVDIKSDYLDIGDSLSLYINDILLSKYSSASFAIQKFINKADIGTEFTYRLDGKIKGVKPISYYFDEEIFKNTFEELNENTLKINKIDNNYISAEATGKNSEDYLFTTIPYDKGWNIYVDGKKIKYDKVFDMFIGFNIGKGKHNIEFKYITPGLKEGILISLLSIFIALLYFTKKRDSKMKKNSKNLFELIIKLYKKYKEIINYGIFGVLTTLVNIFSYYMCAKVFGIQYLVSNVIAIILSILFAYITNRLFVFESKNKNIIKEILLFFYYRLLSSVIDIAIMFIFVSVLHFDDMIIKIISNVVVILLNYIFSKLFIFKK